MKIFKTFVIRGKRVPSAALDLKNNCSTAIAEVVTAVQDLNDLLEELAGSRYAGGSDSMDFSASIAANESNGTISSSVNSMESKWHG